MAKGEEGERDGLGIGALRRQIIIYKMNRQMCVEQTSLEHRELN